jgi:spermidine synthase
MKRRIIFALILLGFSSMAAQIVLMRELFIVFYGNELSLGLTLAGWLFWIGFGSLCLGRRLAGKLTRKLTVFSLTQILLSILLPFSILAIRFIPLVFGFAPGEIIGFIPMGLITFALLFPICILSGFLFVLGCEIYKKDSSEAMQIGYVYILEAIGATLGGLLTSLYLIRVSSPPQIMCLIGILNLLSGGLLLAKRRFLFFSTAIIVSGYILLLASGDIGRVNQYSLRKQWRGFEVLASENSVYGNVVVTKRENLYSLFVNGLYDFTVPDELTAERNAHFPLLEHPLPKAVLLIGGGVSGQLKEVLKHPAEKVDYVELDPLVVDMAKKYLPANEALSDSRVSIITNMDGRRFVRTTSGKYDVVMMSLPEPYTAQLNRFYTVEFFSLVKNLLNERGIFSFCLHSNPNYISAEQVVLYAGLKASLEKVFPEVRVTPGESNYFLASKQKGVLSLDWRLLMERLKERNIQAKYMREYYLFNELSAERVDFFEKKLSLKQGRTAINKDFHPIAYYYDMALWGSQFSHGFGRILEAINPRRIYFGAIALYLFLALPIFFKAIRRKIPSLGVLTCVATTGFAEITFQIITLLSYQALYGYVYYKLGIILTSYMIGLILGGWLIIGKLNKGAGHSLFIKTQVAICIYPLVLPVLFWVFSGLKSPLSFWLGSNIIFPFLPLIAGFIGGFQFPLANSIYLKSIKADAGHSAGLTYGIDLFGSCLGAALTLIILVPVIGISQACILVAGLNLTGLFLLGAERRRR